MKYFFYLFISLFALIRVSAQTSDSITYSVHDFQLKATHGKIYASWLFPCGQGAEYFRLQRTQDFNTIENVGPKILALCNANGYTRFDAIDTLPFYGVSYYRVQVEFATGASANGGWEEARFGDMESNYLTIKPNPVAEDKICYLHWILFQRETVFIQVLDMQGRVVETLANGVFNANVYDWEWDTSHLGRGLYLMKIVIGENEYLQRVFL